MANLLRGSLVTPSDDVLVRRLVPLARPITERRLAPRRNRTRHAHRRLAFPAAVRVVHRVHRRTAHMRTPPQPASPARLAEHDVFVFDVADLPDGRLAVDVHHAEL